MKPEDIEEMKRDRVKSYHKHDWCLEGDFDESGKHPPHGYLSIAWTTEVPICELRFFGAFSEDLSREERKQICAYARRIARVPTLEAEVLRLREALEWQPRETMPDDETEVLMWHRHMGAAVHLASRVFPGVTHWMRLPAPPDEPSEGDAP